MSFVQALLALDYRPIPLSGAAGEKVVDIAIMRTLELIRERTGDVLLASHDGDFLPIMTELLADGGRRVGILGFREFVNSGFIALTGQGLEMLDLEHDAGSFTMLLPRVRIIPIAEFDPAQFI
jgi:uncharacterized protein